MLASAVLTPSESKKLISKAVLSMPEVQNALKNGYLVIHPCSTAVFMYEELTGCLPEGAWVFGYVGPQGTGRSLEAIRSIALEKQGIPARKQWIFYKGVLQEARPLAQVLEEMKEGDVFIKGANAMDPQGNVAVLTPSPKAGGTTGKIVKAARDKKFTIIIPVGVEKLIPTDLSEVISFIGQETPDYALGLPCGLMQGDGIKVDERDALRILAGVESVVGSCGGIDGAEGAVTLFFKGDDHAVASAMELLKGIKGATLPKLAHDPV